MSQLSEVKSLQSLDASRDIANTKVLGVPYISTNIYCSHATFPIQIYTNTV